MTRNRRIEHTQPDPDTERRDDAVIARAFRRSLVALAVVSVPVAIGVYWNLRPTGQAPIATDVPAIAPRPVDRAEPRISPVDFTDITAQSGIRFVHVNGAYGDRLLPETLGSGAAFLDFDNDGDQDLLLVNSSYWPERQPAEAEAAAPALYRNLGDGRFEDVTEELGLDLNVYGMGVAVGDYDNDGLVDLYLTALGENRLYRNLGGDFEDLTATAFVGGANDAWSTSAAFVDYDNDGDLDLFVANYVHWSKEVDFEVDFRLTGIGRAYGPPTAFEGSYCSLYRNEGDGVFADVSREAGVEIDNPATGQPMAKALAVAPVDIDADGWVDLVVANDTVQNFLFHNLGNGRFEEIGTLAGVAFDRNGAATGAMGVDAALFRNDADLGLAVGNFANEMTSLYVTQAGGMPQADEAIVEGIGPVSRQALTFGLFFFDYDLDGRLDLLQANGHLESEINRVQPSQHYRQPPQLFWNCGSGCRSTFVAVPADTLGDFSTPMVGRGASYADIDGDGDLDVLITQNGGPARLLRNDQALDHHWLRVKLQGDGDRVNRDAIGAWVEVVYQGLTQRLIQRRQVMPTRSYLSQVELPITFGLGAAASVEKVRVHWPDGSVQEVLEPPVDATLVIERGRGT